MKDKKKLIFFLNIFNINSTILCLNKKDIKYKFFLLKWFFFFLSFFQKNNILLYSWVFLIKYSYLQRVTYFSKINNLKFFYIFLQKNNLIDYNKLNTIEYFEKINSLKKNEEIKKINNFLRINKQYNHIKKKFSFFKNFWWFYYYWNSIIFKDHLIAVASNNFVYETKNYWHFFLIEDENVRFRLKIDDGVGIDWIYFSTYSELNKTLNANLKTRDGTKNYIKNRIKNYSFEEESEKIVRSNNLLQEARTKLYNEKIEKSKINIKNRTVDVVELRKKVYSNFLNRSFSMKYNKRDLYNLISIYNKYSIYDINFNSDDEEDEKNFINVLQKKNDEFDLYETFTSNNDVVLYNFPINKQQNEGDANFELIFKQELNFSIEKNFFKGINNDFKNYYINLNEQLFKYYFKKFNYNFDFSINIEFLNLFLNLFWLYNCFFMKNKLKFFKKYLDFNGLDDYNLKSFFNSIDFTNLNLIFNFEIKNLEIKNLDYNQHFFLFFWNFFSNFILLNLNFLIYINLYKITTEIFNNFLIDDLKNNFFFTKNSDNLYKHKLNIAESYNKFLKLNLYFYNNFLKILSKKKFFFLSLIILNLKKKKTFFILKNIKKITILNKNINKNILMSYKSNLYKLLDEKKNNFKKVTELTISNFRKSSEVRSHLINLNYFGSFSVLSSEKLFLFTSNEIIQDMIYFYQYQFEYFVLKLMFLNCNDWKWIKLYLTYNVSTKNNINLFFNIDKMYSSNFVQPINFDEKRYKILLLNSGKKKTHRIVKIISKLITTYISKLFIGNYYISLEKISGKTLNKNLTLALNFISQSIVFELIRPNFIQEFIYICIATFSTGDPKFLLRWIIKVLHKISFKKHWRFLYQLKQNILKISRRFIELSKFRGLHIIIKGKIGALGCVRKKTVHIRIGSYGLSRYYLKGDMLYSAAITQTGKIGVKIITSYK